MNCQVCGIRMYEVREEFDTHLSIRWHCPERQFHGAIQGIPTHWRGIQAVVSMARLKAAGYRYSKEFGWNERVDHPAVSP